MTIMEGLLKVDRQVATLDEAYERGRAAGRAEVLRECVTISTGGGK